MERRNFLKSLGAMIAGVALEQAIPLGRVWSFPKEIKLFRGCDWGYEQACSAFHSYDIISDNTAGGAWPQIYYDPIVIREWQANTPFFRVLKPRGLLKRRSTDGLKLFRTCKDELLVVE